MPERRGQAPSSTTSTTSRATTGVRRNLFHGHLSRRPTTSSTHTSTETLRLDIDASREGSSDGSEIVIRDKNGEFEIGDIPMVMSPDDNEQEGEEGVQDDGEKERKRLVDAVKHHQRDRNRAPSEPAELLEAVRASLRAKVMALAEDNWMYEAEDSHQGR